MHVVDELLAGQLPGPAMVTAELAGHREPPGRAALIALLARGMGMQSASVRELSVLDMNTNVLTTTLTALLPKVRDETHCADPPASPPCSRGRWGRHAARHHRSGARARRRHGRRATAALPSPALPGRPVRRL
ncbi:DUF1275 family protein, partial [Nonomuraea longispora]|uniref:DUF1275 family protein n=1 Tax=Nonomuraea longispora TaxID=1848320 RepID=UPI001C702BF5